MKTMKWLIRREMWEHKGMLVWAPAVVAGLIATMATLAIFFGRNISFDHGDGATQVGNVIIEGRMRDQVIDGMANSYMAAALPLYMMLGFLIFFYCLGALHDERRDRSLLFWKSLPVSDQMTVLSKAALALIVTPLITTAIAIVLSVFVVFAACTVLLLHGTNLFGGLLASPAFYMAPVRVLGMLPVYLLWALPTVGWLLLVSSLARSKVFLWAVGIPVVSALLLLWAERSMHLAINAGWFVEKIVNRLLLGVIPGSWFIFELHSDPVATLSEAHEMVQPANLLSASWETLGTTSAWLGVAAGVAMLAAAIWVRRRREEG
jgi:ABC-2 type transport system permease protein